MLPDYNEVAFNEKLAITNKNLHTKYTPFTYNDVALFRYRRGWVYINYARHKQLWYTVQ